MFTLPIACFVLTVLGQGRDYDDITNPASLIAHAEKALIDGNAKDIPNLIEAVESLLAKTTSENQKYDLNFTLDTLKGFKKLLDYQKGIVSGLNPEVDPGLAIAINIVSAAANNGRDRFLNCRGSIEAQLKKPVKPNAVNQSNVFLLRKALMDIERINQLEQDPAKREEVERFFTLFQGNIPPEYIPPDEKNQTGLLKWHRSLAETASRLFGPGSFLHYRNLVHVLLFLQNGCRRGEMPDVDLASEIDKDLAPILGADWSDNFYFRTTRLRALANACLTEKGKNHEKLEKVIEELNSWDAMYSSSNSEAILYAATYRMVMLVQQGRHAECINELGKISTAQIDKFPAPETAIDLYLCAAKSYEALGNKDLALQNQELAFCLASQIPNRKRFLVDFRKSIAKDLRDKYAQNNRIKDARNLEERCQLLGLGFDPLPKQPGE